jgi:signal transduction histidine kinase
MASIQRPRPAVPLDSIMATEELSRRPAREPNDSAVNPALVLLAQTMANSPETVLQRLVETALTLCQAHSSGISLLEEESGKAIFRWHGVAGEYAPHLWGTTPREFSPCGTVLDTDAVQLMSKLDRHFGYFAEVTPRIEEALLIPFYVEGKAVGTIWVISHFETRKFDNEDVRVMKTLGEFAAAAYQVVRTVKALKESKAEIETANQDLLLRNEQLKKAEADLLLVNADLGNFAFAASHDLQEPLRTVTAFTEMLHEQLKDRLDDSQEKIFTIIAEGASRMSTLIHDLLEYSLVVQSGAEPLHQTGLADVLTDTTANIKDAIDGSQATITFDELPSVSMNRTQIGRLFQNLLVNAIKYRREEEAPRIHVSARRGDGHWVISVRDNGEGFAPEYAETIFGLFTRLHGSDVPGSGMGLALCEKIVRRHGGTIWATSVPGEGSVFSFTLADNAGPNA